MLTIVQGSVYISLPIFAEEIKLKPVVITASRIIAGTGSARMPTRAHDTIELSDKRRFSCSSVSSALGKFSVTDVRTRGPYGVQADISLRGAPFEENLVLLDGVNLNDPKSGHHNMDLPLTLYDIEKVNITYGPVSSIYGSGALGGAVNIIPKKPKDNFEFFASSKIGSWDFYSGGASVNIPLGIFKSRSSIEWKRSTGYAPETEFNILTATSYSHLVFDAAKFDVFLGYLTKKFGADSFYSNLYPNEEESVNTGLVYTKGKIAVPTTTMGTVAITPVLYWKRLQDKFILDRNRPAFSRNDHTTNMYGGEVSAQFTTGFGDIALGAGTGVEDITSTNLGDHCRIKQSVFIEYEKKFFDLLVNASTRFDYYSTFGFEFSPSVGFGYEIFPNFVIRGAAARGFRAPTFTELYYSSPANKGNADLKPEKSWTYEAGFNYNKGSVKASGSFFLRNTERIIDWTRKSAKSVWQSENIGQFDLYGVECFLKFDFNSLANITFKYAYLESLDKKGIVSKYVTAYLKHNLNIGLECNLPFGFESRTDFSFRERSGNNGYFLFNSAIYRNITMNRVRFNLFFRIDNILNTKYEEERNLKMPPRAFFAGIDMKF